VRGTDHGAHGERPRRSFSISHLGQPALQIAFLGTIGPDEYLFRLTAVSQRSDDAVLRQHFSLTQRESEVPLWIAKGKANRDIGEILGLSARTVNNHLEQIYVKLGVENRASAAVKAAHVLHET
jgi:DNA-binding CsgD family transcriptional regulator